MASSRTGKSAKVRRSREEQDEILQRASADEKTETYALPSRPEHLENATLIFRVPNITRFDIFSALLIPELALD
jgi:hypothetical protein